MAKPSIKGPLTIVGMVVENFKRVALVSLKPDGSLIEIAGNNGEGKTSLLDAIWVALGGASTFPEQPVRDGQQEATITLDMGEIVVTRTFRRKDDKDPPYTTSLKVEAANGARFDSPQTMLDQMIGSLSFEPMEFLDLDDKGKFDRLKLLVPGVDFDAVDGQNKSDFENRTTENRKAKELRAQAAGIQLPAGTYAPVDVRGLLGKLEAAEEHNKDRAERANNREKAAQNIKALGAEAESLTKQIERLKLQIAEHETRLQVVTNSQRHIENRLAEADPLPAELDTAAIRQKIGEAENANKIARDAKMRDDLIVRAEGHEKAAQALTEAMDARKAEVRAKVAAAEMPVPGLALEDGAVTLNGHAFADASTAEKLTVSILVAMALNPTVKVIRITKGGNDLDKKAMKLIADIAKDRGYQVWCERVIAAGRPTIIMEDGRAKEGA